MKTIYQNLWDLAKAVLRGKFVAVNSYVEKEQFQISILTIHCKELGGKKKNPKLVEGR